MEATVIETTAIETTAIEMAAIAVQFQKMQPVVAFVGFVEFAAFVV